jgi:ferric-dicitrate binding protein FerR (iron transport regulator)
MDHERNDLESRAPAGAKPDASGSLPRRPDPPGAPAPGRAPDPDALSRLLRLAAPRPVVPADRAARVEAFVRDRWQARVRERRRRLLWTLAAAAAVALAVGGSLWIATAGGDRGPVLFAAEIERVVGGVRLEGDFDGSRPAIAGDRLPVGTTLVTSEDGRTALRLAGGGSLRLDRGTRARLDGTDAIELVEGTLYLDSPGDAGDVRVLTRWAEVREIGTQFEVRSTSGSLRVRVREGAIELRPGGAVYEASSGVELALAADGRLTRGAISRHDAAWEWAASIAPPFALDGRTLGEFLAWVSRETGREFRFADEDLAATAPSVVLRGAVVDLTPAQALLAVLPTCGLEHRAVNGSYVLARVRS